MILLLSPAKSLDFDHAQSIEAASQPIFLEEAAILVQKLRKLSRKKLQDLMKVNPDLAELNAKRFAAFETPFHPGNAKPAAMCFKGEVYRGLDAPSLNTPELEYAQRHVRILSGLYGVLRPLDLMQPYRLEMGTRWGPTAAKNNLYKFWGDQIAEVLEKDAEGSIVNLASNEYSKVAKLADSQDRVIDVHFKDWHKGQLKALMTYAKHARGAMARHLIRKQATAPEDMLDFEDMGYRFSEADSTENEWTFTRNIKNT